MRRKKKDVTETELAVLQVIWEHEQATIRVIADALYPEGGASQYATVQKLLERLETKGYVKRRRQAGAHVFSARLGRQDLVGRRLEELTERLCGGSVAPVITHLVENTRLTDEERAALQRLVADDDVSGRKR